MSVPFFLKKKVPDIAVLDPVASHIKLIQGDDVLGKVVTDTAIDAKFLLDGIFRCQQVSHLDIQLVTLVLTYEVNFLVTYLTNGNIIAPAQELHIDDVFQNQVDIPRVASKHSFPDTVVSHIVQTVPPFSDTWRWR